MITHRPHPSPRSLAGFLHRLLPKGGSQLAAIGLALLALLSITYAVAPPAGTSIGNQASATYTDSGNTTRTVVSATVVTIVQQVSSFTLTTDGQTKLASPGAQVTYPHTLTNTGNGTDSFSLAGANAAGNTYNLTNIAIFADANGDGIADNATPIVSTGNLASGGIYKFVIVGTVPGTATAGQTGAVTVTAAGTGSATPEASAIINTDTTTVGGNAVINVTKAISASSGPTGPGTPYTYTLTYTNNGNVTSGPVTLKDTIPAGMNYVQTSARWSVTGATAIDPTAGVKTTSGSAPLTIQYDFGVTTAGAVTAVISQVLPGESRTVTFNVTITANLPPQTIANTATYTYDPGTGTPVGPFTTNTPIFTVGQTAAVTITGQTIASAPQGATVTFTNPVTNNGSGTDSFDLTVVNSTFPAGTVFSLFKSDGVTPLVDTNGNTTPDTGPLATAGVYNVIVQATLPTAATGGPFTAIVTATSKLNSAVSSSANDILTAVTTQTVDLTEDLALPAATATNGKGAGPEASAIATNAATGGTSTNFNLFVNNTSTAGDSFNLQASTDSTFATQVLPAGWSVVFKSGASPVTNTGAIAAGGNSNITAVVTLPAGQGPGTQNIYFRAISPTTNAADTIHDAVTTAAVRSLVVTPNNTAQIVPGGAVFYAHNLVNNGTVLEGDGTVSTVTLTTANNQTGWSSIIYWDKHNSGVIAGDDPVIVTVKDALPGGLPVGGTLPILIKVIAPAAASIGANDRSLLTVTTTNGTYVTTVPPVTTATDDSTVVNGQLSIIKTQASAFVAPPAADGAFSASPITTGALPGKMIRYQIVVSNNGTAPATNIVINDSTPAYTTYTTSGPAAITGQGSAMSVGSVPADAAAGPLVFNVGTLNPGQSATATFGVKINP